MKNIWQDLKTSYHRFEKKRTEVSEYSRQIRTAAKKLIHKILHQRTQNSLAEIKEIKILVAKLLRLVRKNPLLYQVGAINEGLEEYVELVFVEAYLKDDQNILSCLPAPISHDALIGGIADASGELVRLIRSKMDIVEAEKVRRYIANLYEHFLDFEVSRNNKLRYKIGEVRRNLLNLEEIIFNLKIRAHSSVG